MNLRVWGSIDECISLSVCAKSSGPGPYWALAISSALALALAFGICATIDIPTPTGLGVDSLSIRLTPVGQWMEVVGDWGVGVCSREA